MLRPSFASLAVPFLALAASGVLAAACGGNVVVDDPPGTTATTGGCGDNQISCDGECVNPDIDSFNCGDCGIVCYEGFCDEGSCISGPGCPPDLTSCNGDCVDTNFDNLNCGGCNIACPPGSNCNPGGCVVNECFCGALCEVISIGSSVPQSVSAFANELNQWTPSCTGSFGPDVTFSFFAPFDGVFTFDTFGSEIDTALEVMDAGCGSFGCNDTASSGGSSLVVTKLFQGQQVLVVVDSLNGNGGSVQLNIENDGQSCASCGESITNGTPPCPGLSEDLYNALVECVCVGACSNACGDNLCAGTDIFPECQDCVTDTNKGCGNEFNECANDI